MQLGSAEQPARRSSTALADHGLAGLGFGTGFAHEHGARGAASRRPTSASFPLFEVPYDVPFIAVTEKAFTRLVNEQYARPAALDRRARAPAADRAHRARPGRGRRALATLIGGTALRLRRRAASCWPAAPSAASSTPARSRELGASSASAPRRGAPARASRPAELAGRALALPVPRRARAGDGAARRRPGSSPIKDEGGLAELDRLTLHQAVTVVALELLRRRVADDTERRLAGDVLSAAGHRRARRAPSLAAGSSRSGSTAASRDRAQLPRHAARRRARPRSPGAARRVGRRAGRRHGALRPARCCPGCRDDELFELAERVRARVAAATGRALAAGAGRAVAPATCAASFHEARCALEARAMSAPRATANGYGAAHAPARLATYRDLGSFQLLLSLQDDDALRLFCDSHPGADRERRGRLRRRADALAGGLHRVQRPVGARRAPALLPPPHAPLPDPAGRGAHRPRPRFGARPDRVLARPARARARGRRETDDNQEEVQP